MARYTGSLHCLASQGANGGAKALSVIGSMLAGGDSIDDVAVLRAGVAALWFDATGAPSTVGSWLRSGPDDADPQPRRASTSHDVVRIRGRTVACEVGVYALVRAKPRWHVLEGPPPGAQVTLQALWPSSLTGQLCVLAKTAVRAAAQQTAIPNLGVLASFLPKGLLTMASTADQNGRLWPLRACASRLGGPLCSGE